MKWNLKKLFKKETYNINKQEVMEESTDKKIYVWIKSERIGNVVVEDEIKDGWMYFKDGSRINSKIINEFLDVCPTMDEAHERGRILSKANIQTNTSLNKIGAELPKAEEPTVTIKSSKEDTDPLPIRDEDDLMVGILQKLSKKNKTNLDVSVGIHLPSKTIFKALQQDVDDDELRRGLEKLVKNQINNIEDQLNKQVESFIQNYYYEQKRKKTSI